MQKCFYICLFKWWLTLFQCFTPLLTACFGFLPFILWTIQIKLVKSLITQETAVRRLRVAHAGVYSCALFPLNTDFFSMQPWHYRAHYTPSNGCFVHWWWHLYLLCGIFEGTETLVRLQKLDGAWPCKMTLAWLVPVDLTSVSSYPFTRAKMTNIMAHNTHL